MPDNRSAPAETAADRAVERFRPKLDPRTRALLDDKRSPLLRSDRPDEHADVLRIIGEDLGPGPLDHLRR